VSIISPNQIRGLHEEMGDYGRNLFRNVWRGIVAVDILGKMARETRPYEVVSGEADRVYEKCLQEVTGEIEIRKIPSSSLRNSVKAFKEVKVDGVGEKPVIGIVGEIFVRSNEFSNDRIVREIENLGAEVWLAPTGEWLFHVNRTLKLYSRIKGHFRNFIVALITGFIQHYDERKLTNAVEGFLRNLHEPTITELWANSEPYLPGWFGETALSIGKSADYVRKGLSGIINVMPFTCLPGTIATAIFKRF
ncbi:unnamed protein product, partial [marine sediment metagenome]